MNLLGDSFRRTCAALATAILLLSSVALAVTVRPSFAATPSPSSGVAASPYAQAATSASSSIWHPGVATSWQWQLQGTIDTKIAAQMFDIDMFDNSATVVETLHSQGAKVVCYIDAGTWENWRPDAKSFPSSVLGGK